jgi:hypothetical protein
VGAFGCALGAGGFLWGCVFGGIGCFLLFSVVFCCCVFLFGVFCFGFCFCGFLLKKIFINA